jgi:hypothetical protein
VRPGTGRPVREPAARAQAAEARPSPVMTATCGRACSARARDVDNPGHKPVMECDTTASMTITAAYRRPGSTGSARREAGRSGPWLCAGLNRSEPPCRQIGTRDGGIRGRYHGCKSLRRPHDCPGAQPLTAPNAGRWQDQTRMPVSRRLQGGGARTEPRWWRRSAPVEQMRWRHGTNPAAM